MTSTLLIKLFETYKEASLFHRYITTKHIGSLLKKMESNCSIMPIGKSVNDKTIYSMTFGNGLNKILMWSQMHGNESTTTKALFDVFNFLSSKDDLAKLILSNCTIKVVPILNPDGAKAYTRLNANGVDLNRDAQDLSQPESKVLRRLFDEFKPHFCFNLHGQRTIFSAGDTNNSATVSFLAPAQDEKCTVTKNRKRAMEIIAVMNANLQQQIPNCVGIYDDAFNINCVGDTFQTLNVPTVLFEAGHFKGDYAREQTRAYIFQSMLVAIHYIASREIDGSNFGSYFEIPMNQKLFYDIILRSGNSKDIGVLYEERLVGNKVEFVPKIDKIDDLSTFYAHKEVDVRGCLVLDNDKKVLKEGYENDNIYINDVKFSLSI